MDHSHIEATRWFVIHDCMMKNDDAHGDDDDGDDGENDDD